MAPDSRTTAKYAANAGPLANDNAAPIVGCTHAAYHVDLGE
jgi:hypothetical protein